MLCGYLFFEINLKVKDVHGREVKDERLSKGMLDINGITRQASNLECGVETATLVSMHSTLEMNFAFVRDAVEGTVEIRILEGPADLHGEMLLVTIAPEGGAELFQQNVRFASKLNGYAAENMVCGNYKMQVKVTWSIMM
ncbi:hypothetical protein D1007_39269 [Hordeum vulgare]|nr:hypothetical protein D1007_39269 [Hordeum vulgare]